MHQNHHLIIKICAISLIFLSTSNVLSLNQSSVDWQNHVDESVGMIGHIKSSFRDLLDMLRGEVEPVDNRCLSYYRTLADVSARFIECVANYSRPFRVCQNCLNRYLDFTQIHKLIQNVTLFFP